MKWSKDLTATMWQALRTGSFVERLHKEHFHGYCVRTFMMQNKVMW
ncbi:hypothetical protein [Paenibacillus sp. Soil766]|nr:hypothetical protein [Paenibacillus sp. Soil766]